MNVATIRAEGGRGLAVVAAAALLVGGGTPAAAQSPPPLETGLSTDRVAIATGYAGAELVLFGTRRGEGEIVAIVRGPPTTHVVRKRIRVAGLWMNRESRTLRDVPGYYAVAASAPLEQIADDAFLAAHRIGAERLMLDADGAPSAADVEAAEFRAALVQDRRRAGLYADRVAPVTFAGPSLFRAEFRLPAAAPVGAYEATVHLLREGALVATDTMRLSVTKTGVGRAVYDYAHEQPVLYGLAAVLLALLGGWVAAAVFRRA